MNFGTLLIILLIVAMIAVLPTWKYSYGWGYAPASVVGTLLLIVIALALLGKV